MATKAKEVTEKSAEIEVKATPDKSGGIIQKIKSLKLLKSEFKTFFNAINDNLEEDYEFIADGRAQSNFMDRGINLAVGILVIGLLTAYLLPIAISEIVGVDTSSWGSAEAQLFELMPIFFVLGILLYIVNKVT
jgi:hypothetical protein